MPSEQPWQIQFEPGGREVFDSIALDPTRIFDDQRIKVWRNLPERQNCLLDIPEKSLRIHIKRYQSPHGPEALIEKRGIALLNNAGIATVPLLAVGVHRDGRGFMVSQDLAGLVPADKLLATEPGHALRIADLARHLHRAHLHHRDLYLCHFLLKPGDLTHPVHLIDAGRVASMPPPPFHLRWLSKDLAQLLYSVEDAGLPAHLGRQLLDRYLEHDSAAKGALLRLMVPIKVAFIRRHDLRARRKRPGRRVSIDSAL